MIRVWKEYYRELLRSFNGRVVLIIMAGFLFTALFADFLANERPLFCQKEGKVFFPVARQYLENLDLVKPYPFAYQKSWQEIEFEKSIYPPVPYSPNTIHAGALPYQSPLSRTSEDSRMHILGTDQIGRDVAAGIIHGSRTALLIGIFSMLIASILGIWIGAISGYFGDEFLKIKRWMCMYGLLSFFFLIFYLIYGRWAQILLFSGLILFIGWLLHINLKKVKKGFLARRLVIPVDLIIMRCIELFKSIPALFILLALMALIDKPSIYNIILIIGFLRWTSIARLVRAEMLHIRESEYILASKALAQSPFYILWKHAIPNALIPATVAIAFGVSSAIILEATISFLGIGLGAEDVTWGSLLSAARRNFSAWWLAIFPGLAIFLVVYLFNSIGDQFHERNYQIKIHE